ncbi:MAG: response regulator [Dehalococcoidales bacterium]|nr:response regulator [Dehalococcoidales bacterium]
MFLARDEACIFIDTEGLGESRVRLKVLAVDDDERMRRLLRVNLETEDIEVKEAGTGEECLRLVRDESADLILLDLNLPDGSGWDVLATIRSASESRDIPVIVLSVAPPDASILRRLEPDDFLLKPFDARELTSRVRKVLDKRVFGE